MSNCNRITIERVENGYTVEVWKSEEESEMYVDPEKYVAKDSKEVMTLVSENLKD